MEIVTNSRSYRNAANNCTIKVEKYFSKYAAVPFWRVVYRYDSSRETLFQVRRDGLTTRPNTARVLAGF